MDTDILVKKSFPDNFFEADLVLGYMYECAISSAVIMAAPKHPYIKGLLDMYLLIEEFLIIVYLMILRLPISLTLG